VRDLGGEEQLSTQERWLIDVAVRMRAKLEAIEPWLLAQPSLVDKRHRRLLPVAKDAQGIADSLVRILDLLGLARRRTARSPYDTRP
jgi:hypothetical protein